MLNRLRLSLARLIAPKGTAAGTRMYGSAKSSRLTGGFAGIQNSSADAELSLSLTQLRARSRQLVRDAGYAKRAKVLIQNNVVGSGVGIQANVSSTRGAKRQPLNDAIEAAFRAWSRARHCHTGAVLHFHEIERMAMGQVFEAGEVIIRMHNRAMPGSRVPLALEIIEAERLADEYTTPGGAVPSNVRMGVELDDYFRPVAYWIREGHPGDLRGSMLNSQRFTRVPADQILHLKITDRWPQTRGEPWMHAAIRKLHDMDEYSGAELTAARASANYFGTIESTDENPLGAETQADGEQFYQMEAGIIQKLDPGEKFQFHTPNRPNAALDAFMRYMLREVAAGIGVSYESLSRDYSQSNYSSSRLALLDDRDLWRVLQQWWIRTFREPLHSVFLQRAVLAGAVPGLTSEQYFVDPDRYEAVRWKLRGWTWVDPTKEVNAYKEAVKAGFTTVTKVIEQTGAGDDIEDVIEQREHELELMEEAGLRFDTDPTLTEAPAAAATPAPEKDGAAEQGDAGEDARMRIEELRRELPTMVEQHVRAQIDPVKATDARQQSEVETSKARIAACEEAVGELRERAARFDATADAMASEVSRCSQTITQVAQRADETKGRVDELRLLSEASLAQNNVERDSRPPAGPDQGRSGAVHARPDGRGPGCRAAEGVPLSEPDRRGVERSDARADS